MSERPAQEPPPHAAAAPAPQTSGYAIASLALGIAGITILPFLGSILAVVFGVMARSELRREPTLGGEGLATAGLVLGWVGVAVFGIALILLIVGVLLFVAV